MPPLGFEPTISAGEQPQTYAFRLRGDWDRPTYYYKDEMKEAEMDGTCNAEMESEKCVQKVVEKTERKTPRVFQSLVAGDLQREIACNVK
jgi:hypothetical protein